MEKADYEIALNSVATTHAEIRRYIAEVDLSDIDLEKYNELLADLEREYGRLSLLKNEVLV